MGISRLIVGVKLRWLLLLLLGRLRHRRPLIEPLLRSIAVRLGTTSSRGTRGYISRRIWPVIPNCGPRLCPLLLGIFVSSLVSGARHVLGHGHGPLDRPKSRLRRRSSVRRHAVWRRSLSSSRALVVSRIVSLHVRLPSSHRRSPLLDRGRASASARWRSHGSALTCIVRAQIHQCHGFVHGASLRSRLCLLRREARERVVLGNGRG